MAECWDCGEIFPRGEMAHRYSAEEMGLDADDPDSRRVWYRCRRCDEGVTR